MYNIDYNGNDNKYYPQKNVSKKIPSANSSN
jgi:hypothetical protein